MAGNGKGGGRRVEVFDGPRGVYLDVCAGAGGLGLGLHRAGWRGTGLERDPDAVRTHRARVGPCRKVDVTTARAPRVCNPIEDMRMAGPVPSWDQANRTVFDALCAARPRLRGIAIHHHSACE